MLITNGIYIFDSFGAEYFHEYFNDLITKYGSVTVADVFDNPLLLGLDHPNLVRNIKDHEEFTKISYFRVGWDRRIPMTEMFSIQESRGRFVYVLNLPDYKALG